ncbi:MAG: phosphate acyltransferase PlsX [Nitrospinae bacterium]|nr:phosphate acyltransferase PlsX [Nitrospinota bacterium]
MAWKIAVDAMGGDKGPGPLIEGALLAAREFGSQIVLVGDEHLLETELKVRANGSRLLAIRHASQVIDMGESPASAFRKKKGASIRVATEMVQAGEAHAVISAGHTGATLMAATVILKPLQGIDRPAIATLLPTMQGHSIIVDVGANVDCKPLHLYQFGIMGSVYAKYLLNQARPRVGLLSIGEEDNKGNEITKEAFQMLRKSSLNFVGNVEPKGVYRGFADVVVCDGFIGNIALKISESFAEMLESALKEAFTRDTRSKAGYLLLKPSLARLKQKMDYAEYGGAPLLGVNGTCLIAHGTSSPKAIKNAIGLTERLLTHQVNTHIQEDLAANEDMQELNGKKVSLWRHIRGSIPFSREREDSEHEAE